MAIDLKQKITEDMKTAMRGGNTKQRDAIRLLQAAIKQKEVDERIILDDSGVIAVIEKMLKQRKDSSNQYEAAQRFDLANNEKDEVLVLGAYMPKPLNESEISALISEAIAEVGAVSMQDMGKIIAILKPKLTGRADMSEVSTLIKEKISI